MRRFLHGLFVLTVLLGGIGVEPASTALPVHVDCCCGNEAQCPCDLPRAPQAPRCPANAPAPTAVVLPAAVKPQDRTQAEALPWQGLAVLAPRRISDVTPLEGSARELPHPPDRSLQRLSELSTFRI